MTPVGDVPPRDVQTHPIQFVVTCYACGEIILPAVPPQDEPVGFAALRTSNVARDKEWNTGAERTSLAFRGLELGGEAGEALNVIKKLERERIGIRGSRATLNDLAEELADIVICADLIAMDCDIDLGAAVERKFNATSQKYGLATLYLAPPKPEKEE